MDTVDAGRHGGATLETSALAPLKVPVDDSATAQRRAAPCPTDPLKEHWPMPLRVY